MHVALHYDALVPPVHYGGTERVVYWLGVALQKLGHRVTLLAREGSQLPGAEVVPLAPDKTPRDLVPDGVDVLHTRHPHPGDVGVPCVISIDGHAPPGELFEANSLFVSRKHAELYGSSQYVYNGIDPEVYACERERDDYAVFLGNPSWDVKNIRGAVEVARAAGVRLEVIGPIEGSLRWKRFLPRLRGVTWRGGVDDAEKRALLSRARALVFPVRWHEPFGLAMTEALASGCPVLGTPYGSLPEIVTRDVGLLSANGDDLARALRRNDFEPQRCRARVLDGFTHMDMARALVRHYEAALRTGHIADRDPTPPRNADGFVYHRLLPWTPPA